jgi:hypothetical protein
MRHAGRQKNMENAIPLVQIVFAVTTIEVIIFFSTGD